MPPQSILGVQGGFILPKPLKCGRSENMRSKNQITKILFQQASRAQPSLSYLYREYIFLISMCAVLKKTFTTKCGEVKKTFTTNKKNIHY